MTSTLVYERNAEHWVSNEIERFFRELGYRCESFPIQAGIEKQVPADFAFSTSPPTKLFGLQYKVLYGNGKHHWRLSRSQHEQLGKFDWIYYGLSELESAAQRGTALHSLRIKSPNFPFSQEVSRSQSWPYRHWWPFLRGLLTCRNGVPIRSRQELIEALSQGGIAPGRLLQDLAHVFLVDRRTRRLVSFRNQDFQDDSTQ